MKNAPQKHTVDTLRAQCRADSMRPFNARGANVIRCPHCLMAEFACFCHLRESLHSPIEFILLFHRDEIHKPTNSGRLIADLFPNDTQAYLWSRTTPSLALLNHLKSRQGRCTLLFPNTTTAQAQNRPIRIDLTQTTSHDEKHCFIILDGTWKQASKMFHQSEWLKDIPHFEINSEAQRSFLVRHSGHTMQFATAEVTAMLLDTLGHQKHSQRLLNYYQTFNKRCLISRKRGATQSVENEPL
ncbi:DTW domain-containing protein [Marinomonas sp. M1K-6]|uniref:tRNA-uridine aminocarboxypropyltransferase n=1 Tax=Marinomonas profundi TaxID=2726122 RepID=A0A847RBI7_9GAMM|nr:tRNA-uridine aminocarboxypropyltransferase [Marinomonas profundi]NLQ18617.1 DTW domain-containing protein [Marinomonas profundi]UDV02889.1 DTW domain-containing protein [Marinomonas profundi]